MNVARDDSLTSEDKYKGFVNDAYTREIPRMHDWRFLTKESSIACTAVYNTGTVSVNSGSANVTGVGTTWTVGMTPTYGFKIKFTGNDLVYDFTYASATTATISPVLSGANNLSGAGYKIWRDEYALASDFSRFLGGEEGGLKIMRSGKWEIAHAVMHPQWKENYRADVSDNTNMCKLIAMSSDNTQNVQINPPTQTAIVLPYDYIKTLTPMTEYTTGYISALTSGATGVTGVDTVWNSTANVDTSTYTYYFRIDADGTADSSVWYKISSIGGATTLTLSSAYGGTTIASGTINNTYTISRIPNMPDIFHDLIIYSAALKGIADQGDPNYQFTLAKKREIQGECKMLHKSRRLGQQFGVDDDYRGEPHYDWR